jgi:hypothetical protein
MKTAWVPYLIFGWFAGASGGPVAFLVVLGVLVSYTHWWVIRNKARTAVSPDSMGKRELREGLKKSLEQNSLDQGKIAQLEERVQRLLDEKANPNLVIKVLGQVMGVLIEYDKDRTSVTAEQAIEVLRAKLYGLEKRMAEELEEDETTGFDPEFGVWAEKHTRNGKGGRGPRW